VALVAMQEASEATQVVIQVATQAAIQVVMLAATVVDTEAMVMAATLVLMVALVLARKVLAVDITQAVTALLIRILVMPEVSILIITTIQGVGGSTACLLAMAALTLIECQTAGLLGFIKRHKAQKWLGLLTGDGAMIFGEGILALDHLSAAVASPVALKQRTVQRAAQT
jgi:hypothetical protein